MRLCFTCGDLVSPLKIGCQRNSVVALKTVQLLQSI